MLVDQQRQPTIHEPIDVVIEAIFIAADLVAAHAADIGESAVTGTVHYYCPYCFTFGSVRSLAELKARPDQNRRRQIGLRQRGD